MLEITIRSSGLSRFDEGTKEESLTLKSFRFENDELQAFLAEAYTNEHRCQVVSLQALGSPLTVSGEPLKPAKIAGPGAPRPQAPGINTPLQEQARESGTLRQPTTVDAAWKAADKAKAERDAAAKASDAAAKAAQPPKPEKK